MRVWPAPYTVSLCAWFVFEIGLLVRDLVRRRTIGRRDRGTRAALAVGLCAGVVVSSVAPGLLPRLDLPAPRAFAAAGIVVFWAGLALRAWAVVTLGRYFRTFIGVDADQTVVRRGPYRLLRHPSYTGILLVVVGFGIGSANGLGVAAAVLLPLPGALVRIRVEESELVRELGEPYREYQRTTRRLVPGIW